MAPKLENLIESPESNESSEKSRVLTDLVESLEFKSLIKSLEPECLVKIVVQSDTLVVRISNLLLKEMRSYYQD